MGHPVNGGAPKRGITVTSSYRAALIAMGIAGLAAACTGGSQVVYATGTCQTQNERCNARCERLGDARECVESCLLDARLCMKAQGSGGPVFGGASEPPRISEHKALLVDFSGERPRASPELTVELTGTVEAFDGVHRLQPGGGVGVRFLLPEDLREAEVLIEHAPGGDGTDCFVTITVGSHALASRYAPPRTKGGALRTETWNLTPLIETLRAEQQGDAPEGAQAGAQEKRPLVLFIYNNQAAGSRAPYRLGTVQLLYRTLALPPGARPDAASEGRSNSSFTAPR